MNAAWLIHRIRQDFSGLALPRGTTYPDDEFHPMNLISASRQLAPKKTLFDMSVFDMSWLSGLSLISQYAATPGAYAQVSFLNANNVTIMMRDEAYRKVLDDNIVLPDGIGLDLAASLIDGQPFAANLNGTDFIPALMTYMEEPRRIGLIGGRPAVLAGAVASFRKHAPWHHFIPVADGYFDNEELPVILERLEQAEIDILLVGMGTPLQEKWISTHIGPQHCRVVFGVGALFDFVSGTMPRAPYWVRRIRCEWIYRLLHEPGRLWRRYLIGIPVFLFHVLRYRLKAHKKE
ncbi:WecB/TagA/CpsF family glycosyltransferase [Allorhizobium sp. BGMRC 0089]|uniref:WecB/TagA/CpsF family glycosyltransferase n=1 Tax=Allorhizobium sonneratiae TaxID=2934936 RepID=UPI002034961C|nr:WecB/TagA/CpsF family glycosyltransferase [Allorhizobium sonneratiae]MCM2291392.1 WecB/TagA/CpsF family glycosyltransferase [Allorhizobium sonneratiae]